MGELLQSDGTPHDADELVASDVIIPLADLTLKETRALFSYEVLVPDLPAYPRVGSRLDKRQLALADEVRDTYPH